MRGAWIWAVAVWVMWSCSLLAQSPPSVSQSTQEPSSAQQRTQLLQRLLQGAVLEGQYTVEDAQGVRQGKDRYEILQVRKLQGDYWALTVRIQYDGKDVKVPLSVPVAWVGSTPVIYLDRVPVPFLGTFSARVVILGDRYAGVWDAGDHGGHLWGRIIRAKSKSSPSPAPSSPDQSKKPSAR